MTFVLKFATNDRKTIGHYRKNSTKFSKRAKNSKREQRTRKRVESRRINIIRYLRSVYSEDLHNKIKVRVYRMPFVDTTKKALGARMGKGKGAFHEKLVIVKKTTPRYKIRIPPMPNPKRLLRQSARSREKKLGFKVIFC